MISQLPHCISISKPPHNHISSTRLLKSCATHCYIEMGRYIDASLYRDTLRPWYISIQIKVGLIYRVLWYIGVSFQIESISCIQLLFSDWLMKFLYFKRAIFMGQNRLIQIVLYRNVSWHLGSNISIHVNHVSSHLYCCKPVMLSFILRNSLTQPHLFLLFVVAERSSNLTIQYLCCTHKLRDVQEACATYKTMLVVSNMKPNIRKF